MTKLIYHITPQDQWGQAYLDGNYQDESLEAEGFIHCCYKEQLPYISNNYFKGQDDLVILEIDVKLLDCPVKEEQSRSVLFPHVYGPIPVSAVLRAVPLFWDRKTKKFEKPQGL